MKPLYKYRYYESKNRKNMIPEKSDKTHDLLGINEIPVVNENIILHKNMLNNTDDMPEYFREINNLMIGLFFLFFIRKHWHR